MPAAALLLRLEGPLQAWGDPSKFVIRRTMDAPTKSSVLGMICSAEGLSREQARERLLALNALRMGVRIDRAGARWWDYHTVGAGVGVLTAKGKVKKTESTGEIETLVTRREYLADASFLVALRGEAALVRAVHAALDAPKRPLFLGRKCCPPALPILERPWEESGATVGPLLEDAPGLEEALARPPWRARVEHGPEEAQNGPLDCLVEWDVREGVEAPPEAEVWYDAPVSFDPPVHGPRLVLRGTVEADPGGPIQQRMPGPPRPRADYNNTEYKRRRAERLARDHHLCVFCKAPGTTVQHVTYRRAGGDESPDDLRALCRLCHDAVTMIEYGLGMGLDRIDPTEPRWRDRIIEKRREIVDFRSLETRRRRLEAKEVE